MKNKSLKNRKVISFVVTASIVMLVCGGFLFLLFGTESGKRTVRDFQSNISGGVERVVEVYDVHGELIEIFEGKFDVTHDDNRIRFDDENGKRHTIYYTTGTVIITEK